MPKESDISSIRRDVQALRRRVERRAIIQQTKANVMELVLEIDQGNTLETSQLGIKYQAGLSSVPSAYDPNTTTSFVDGIGRGRVYRNGVLLTGYFLIVNADYGTFKNALLSGDRIYSSARVAIPVGSGPAYVYAYVAG